MPVEPIQPHGLTLEFHEVIIGALSFPSPLAGEGKVGARARAARMLSSTSSVSVRTWLSQNLRTRYPRDDSHAVRRSSSIDAAACWLPSTSSTTRALRHAKSTTYGPIGTWRRKRRPAIWLRRSRIQRRSSVSVLVERSPRARSISERDAEYIGLTVGAGPPSDLHRKRGREK